MRSPSPPHVMMTSPHTITPRSSPTDTASAHTGKPQTLKLRLPSPRTVITEPNHRPCSTVRPTKRRRQSQRTLPALPLDAWRRIAHYLPLSDTISLSLVSHQHAHAARDLANLALAGALNFPKAPDTAITAARTVIELAYTLSKVAAEQHGGFRASLRALVNLPTEPSPTLAFETVLSATTLPSTQLPAPVLRTQSSGGCTVTHTTYAPPHLLGARAGCATVYALDAVLASICKRGLPSLVAALSHARSALRQLRARAKRAGEAQNTLADMRLPADAAYVAALANARAALAGDEHVPPLRATLQRALDVHYRLRVEFRWLLGRDGHARSRAAVVLAKAIKRECGDLDRAARAVEKALWWAHSPQNLRSLKCWENAQLAAV